VGGFSRGLRVAFRLRGVGSLSGRHARAQRRPRIAPSLSSLPRGSKDLVGLAFSSQAHAAKDLIFGASRFIRRLPKLSG